MDIRAFQYDPAVYQMLQARARLLASQAVVDDVQLGEEHLTFSLGDAHYSLPLLALREVIPLRGYTALPLTPRFVVGLVNVRGHLLTLLDLRPLLDLATPDSRSGGFVLIVRAGGCEVGLFADEVVEVGRGSHALLPALTTGDGRVIPWLRGIDGQLSLHIDLARLLRDPQLLVDTRHSA